MAVNYTSLLGLAKPVTGTEAGLWGDVVNDYLTTYLDAAVAGAQTISGTQTAVTLTVTTGSALVQAAATSAGSAQYQIINCTGSPAATLVITAPAASKVYLVINATSTNQPVTVRGAGPTTGVTIPSLTRSLIAWNGSDYILIASNRITDLTGTLATGNGGTGLTTFTAANNAIYSTSSSALTAGTLPVAAGGTGATTLTGVVKASGTSAFTASNVSLSSEVTGTLPVGNGGTGATTLTANNVLVGNGTSAIGGVAPGTTGNVLTSNGTSWASTANPYIGARFQAFTTSGTFTVPTGVTSVKVTVVARGGEGGSISAGVTSYQGAGGGGSGGCGFGFVTGLTPGGTVSVTVGTSNASKASSFGTYITATGGSDAANTNGITTFTPGGIGGSAGGTSYFVISGGNSGAAGQADNACALYSIGGAGGTMPPLVPWGNGGAGNSGSGGNGGAGSAYGGGGGGASKTNISTPAYTGGAGGNGVVLVEW